MTDSPVFVDVETTGLDPDRHVIWEAAVIADAENRWLFDVSDKVADADPEALRANRYFERGHGTATTAWHYPAPAAAQIAAITRGKVIVGVNPWFDAAFLDRFLRSHGCVSEWDYHLVDVKTFAAGWLAGRLREGGGIRNPPWDTADLCVQLGINPADHFADRHTALGDARLAKAIYEGVMRHG